jgi:catechol 2,3-dioxygenase-like lactoylglutathione lyase family enzyme
MTDLPEQGGATVSELNGVGAITMFVEDPKRSRSFYENVFEVSPIYEDDDAVAFQFENTIINLLRDSRPAEELIAPATVAGAATGSRFQLTIWVDDADAVSEELRNHGVELLNGPMDREWGMRTASFTDPDGHIWEVAAKIPE